VVSLDTEQLDQLKRIGAFLAEVREETGRSLDDIATKTYIPLRLLKAIETGQEQILPEPVFVQGFIRRYGDALGLDGNDLAKQFPVNTANPLPDPKPADLPAPAAYVPNNEPIWQPSELAPSRPPYWLIGGAALLALAGLFFVVIQPNLKSTTPVADAPAPRPQVSPVAPVIEPVVVPSASVEPSIEPSVEPSAIASSSPTASSPVDSTDTPSSTGNSPVAIDVNLTDEAWVQVVVDGKVEYEGTLVKGDKKSWVGKESIVISSGNAGAVSVAFNKGKAKTMGELGAVEDKTFTPKGEQ
jgi:cytoskeleton protein RodZ